MTEGSSRAKTHLPAEAPASKAHARLPRAHEHYRRPEGAAGAPQERPPADRDLLALVLVPAVGTRGAQRLRHRRDIAAIHRRGRPFRGEFVTIRTLKTGLAGARFGFAVGGTVGNAVVRNLVRRRLREIVWSLPAGAGWDVMVSARPAAARSTFDELRRGVRDVLQRSGVLESR